MIYYPGTLPTLNQQLTDINKSYRKVAPSDESLFIQRQTSQKDAKKN